MVALEAWAMGKPVLANAKCDVLQGQCLRSNAGLFYDNFPEFAETLRAIDTTPSLQAALGRNGRTFFERHYAWPVVVKKYTDMLEQLARTPASAPMEPLAGWWARRRHTLPPADAVVKQLPAGPYRESRAPAQRSTAAAPATMPVRPPRPEGQHGRGHGEAPRRPDPRRPEPRRPESKDARQDARPDRRQPPETSAKPKSDQGRDHRRGRNHRRGRRPGPGGGGR
jgi:hypothetical protein